MKFVRATKYNSFLKLGLAGTAGSGKTFTALKIAESLSTKRIALIDAELGSASKYADKFDFDVNELSLDDKGRDIEKPFTPSRYIEAIKTAYESGEYDVLIIDGISPEWDDAGGTLQYVDELQRVKKLNTRDAWAVATPFHRNFINYILRVRMHVICTMRAKKETVVVKDGNGKAIGKKVTLDPVQREDVPYVFDVLGLMQDKEMIIDKTRCSELDDKVFVRPGKEVADIVREWLKGDPMPERPEYDPTLVETQKAAQPSNAPVPAQATADTSAMPITDQQRSSIRKLCQHLGKPEPEQVESLLYASAKELIAVLSQEYRESRAKGNGSTTAQPATATPLLDFSVVYGEGGRKGLWTKDTFYGSATDILGEMVSGNNVCSLAQDKLQKLHDYVVSAKPVEPVAAS